MISRWMHRSKFWHSFPFAILIEYLYFVFELTIASMAAILKKFLVSQFTAYSTSVKTMTC